MEMSKGTVADIEASTTKDTIIKDTDFKKGYKNSIKMQMGQFKKFSKYLAVINIQLGSVSSGCWGLGREVGVLS